jgi:hypothetical protein
MDASGALQSCINNAVSGSILELPPGKYTVAKQIKIRKPLTLRTQGKTQSMARCQLNDATCAEIIADPNLAEQWGVVTIGTPGANDHIADGLIFDHIIINGNNRARWNGPGGANLAAQNTGIGHNLMVFSCSNCQFTNNVFKNGLAATGFGYGYVNTTQGFAPVNDHDSIVKNNLIAYNGVHDRSLSWSDGFTMHDGTRFTISDNEFVDNTDIDFLLGGCIDCIIQRNTVYHTGTFEGSSWAAFGFQAWIYSGAQYSSGDYTGSDISNNTADCSADRRCGFGLYLGSKAWGFAAITLKGGNFHDNTVTGAQQGLNIDTITSAILSNNTVVNSGGTFLTSRGTRTMGICNIAPDASVAFSGTDPARTSCTSERWDNPFELPNWWTQDWKTAVPVPTGLSATCSANGTQVTLSWGGVSGTTRYLLRVDDESNQAAACTAPSVSGSGGICVSPTDFVHDSASNPITVTITPGKTYAWWVHAQTAAGQSAAAIGTSFSCNAPDVPTGLSAQCIGVGQARFSWNPVTGATSYALRVNDTTNTAAGCTSPSVTGAGGTCMAPTDYVYDLATSPTILTVPSGKMLEWWVHAIKPAGIGSAAIGAPLTCVAN